MISKQTVYLAEDRQTAVAEGDPKAKFLLVREGHEISQELAEKHDATALVGGVKKNPSPKLPADAGPQPKNREETMPKRKTRKK